MPAHKQPDRTKIAKSVIGRMAAKHSGDKRPLTGQRVAADIDTMTQWLDANEKRGPSKWRQTIASMLVIYKDELEMHELQQQGAMELAAQIEADIVAAAAAQQAELERLAAHAEDVHSAVAQRVRRAELLALEAQEAEQEVEEGLGRTWGGGTNGGGAGGGRGAGWHRGGG